MRNIPPLNALKAFEAAGRHLNFRRAAEELGVSQGAVAQQVRALEATLSVKLFTRHARGLTLTNEGRRYLPSLRRAFDMIAEATENLSPKEAVLTVSTTPSLAARWLVPRLGQLAADLPDIRLRLDASNTLANFQSDGIDIAIRLAKPPFAPGLAAQPLFDAEIIAVCHPELAAAPKSIRTASDLQHHVLLEDTHGHWPVYLEAALAGAPLPELNTMTFSQTSLAIDAAIAGQGVALTSRALVASDLKAQRLCQPIAFAMNTEESYFVVTPRKSRHPALAQRLSDWLQQQGSRALC